MVDLYIRTQGSGRAVPTYNLLVLGNQVVNGWYYPRSQSCTTAGALISGEYTKIPVWDYVTITLEHADVGDTVSAWFMLE